MNKQTKISVFLIVCFSIICLTSCSRKVSTSIPIGEDELPDMIMHEATYVFGDAGRRPLIMDADVITVYSGKNGRTLLENLTFVQEEESEEGVSHVEMEGSCDSAYINSDNSVAKMTGNVRLTKKTDNFTIECDSLEWDDDKQIINTESNVYVKYEDGTELKAIGFSAQLEDNIYEFGQIIEGRYKDEN